MFEESVSLKEFNTFGIDVLCRYFGEFASIVELKNCLDEWKKKDIPLLILGGGSNILLTKDFPGLVLKNNIAGYSIVSEDYQSTVIESGAGEVWHDFVLKTLSLNLSGLENLSLIPGSVGASPMQNIGAYGVEIKDVFDHLKAYHIESGEIHTFDNKACEFGYRESIFKRKLQGQYIILTVAFRLSKNPELKTSYGAISAELEAMQIQNATPVDISNAVIRIRQSKLPNPTEIGNAGSFFKNPVVDKSLADFIAEKHPDLPFYPVPNNPSQVKLAAGWLIEKAGLKGKTIDNYGVHKKQALVLVNYGGATGQEILSLSEEVIQTVQSHFGVTLEREVNIL